MSKRDAEIIKDILATRAEIAARLLSEKLGIAPSAVPPTSREWGKGYLSILYSSTLEKYGWRQIELLIATVGGTTMSLGKELLKREEVAYVARTIGQFNIDLKVEVFVRSNDDLINLIEEVKAMDGVKELIWSEIIEVVGRTNHIPAQVLEALKAKAAVKPLR
ncbi:MAG: hypothetical protein JRN44_03410 [Nitrososphaerota archaeon]|nr:hypothetical protein [Nitrososphaerota archaeon]MDG6947554.1 hypothetical protein [Nitrososphaerota archaeon]